MSSPKFRLEMSEEAVTDFRDLLSYTLQTWGEAQLIKYRDSIDTALKAITEGPQVGRKRHGRMVYSVGRHRIFFRIDNDTIYVLRILHDRMDVVRHLRDED